VGKNNRRIYSAVIGLIISLTLVNVPYTKVFAEDDKEYILDIGKQLVHEYYIEEIPDAKLNEAKDVDSLIKSLNDPYSTYFTEKEYNDFNSSLNNSFAGIGIQIEVTAEGIKIVAVFDKSPAMEAGLKVGDIVIKADERALKGMSTEEAVTYIRGEAGTKVNLQVKRKEENISYQVERRQIVLPTVTSELIDKHIGYIRINTFGENTGIEFKSELDKLRVDSADSYIVDLRSNPGGYMNVAFDIAGYFIGDNIVMKAYPKSGETITYKAVDNGKLIDKPVIFLINHYSASASEILSAALKDYKKAFFIGEKTFGKGVAQSLFMLPDNSYIKLTTFRFVSPLGNEIHKVGVSPDVELKDEPDKNIDSLKAAEILLSGVKEKADKSGTIKAAINGREFVINLDDAKSNENIDTFKHMSVNVFNTNNTLLGSINGWEKFSQNISLKDFLFPAPVIAPPNAEIPKDAVKAPEVKPEVNVKIEASELKAESESKEAASVNTLPKTGTPFDLYVYVTAGVIFVVIGILVSSQRFRMKKEE
jgi:carboxyl-terminal processing protease